ncbi:lipopolysaccharide biosynthesis protein [Rhodococcus pyridinivorans]|uniref:lipopolysaccharide biosynthesis protein n=1 Tax=Rhodococcus pyridinivorans TaxID=103816 RepID=UPI0020C6A8E0|nr:lipopolysaccharide biosynthesis protein [Rhodococcus pyridinivorans]UTM36542.1 lipopolysaccharide biosynthesis protein [Rhodococcus pyridinivorans]
MSLGKVAARGTVVSLGGQWTKFIVQLASITILARVLTPTDFGVMAMILAIVGAATVLGDFGLSLAAIQAKNLTENQRANLFWINSSIGVTLSIVVYLLADPIARFYEQPQLVGVTQALAVIFFMNGVVVQLRADLTRSMRFGALALCDVLAQVVALAVSLSLAFSGYGVWALVAQQICVAGTTLLCSAWFVRWIPGLPRRNANMRKLLSFGGNTMATQLVNYSSANIDSVLLGRVRGAFELGIYDRAYQLFKIPMQQMAAPMTRVALPVLMKLEDAAEYMRYLVKAQKGLSYALLMLFAFAAGAADPLLRLALGEGWDEAPAIFRILAIGGAFQALAYVYYWIFLSTGRVDLHFRFSLVGRLIMIGAIAAGVNWGAIGTAIGSSFGFFALWLIYSAWGVPRTGVSSLPIMKSSIRPVGLAVGLFSVLLIGDNLLPDGLPAVILLVGLAFLGCFYVFVVLLLVRGVRADLIELARVAYRAVGR